MKTHKPKRNPSDIGGLRRKRQSPSVMWLSQKTHGLGRQRTKSKNQKQEPKARTKSKNHKQLPQATKSN